jgi:hypothetical protein
MRRVLVVPTPLNHEAAATHPNPMAPVMNRGGISGE